MEEDDDCCCWPTPTPGSKRVVGTVAVALGVAPDSVNMKK